MSINLLAFLALAVPLPDDREPVELHYSRGPDGYSSAQFKPTTTPNPAMVVTQVTYASRKALQEAARLAGASNPDTLMAFSARTESGSRCTIHTMDPKVSYEPEQVGHEMLHCLYGSWHDESFQPTTARRLK